MAKVRIQLVAPKGKPRYGLNTFGMAKVWVKFQHLIFHSFALWAQNFARPSDIYFFSACFRSSVLDFADSKKPASAVCCSKIQSTKAWLYRAEANFCL